MAGCIQKWLYLVDRHFAAAAADGSAAAAAAGCAHGFGAAARYRQQLASVSASEPGPPESSAERDFSGSACQPVYAFVSHSGAAAAGSPGGLQRGRRKA